MEDTRLVRDLLDANLRLTEQVCEMARLVAIDAPSRLFPEGASMPHTEPEPAHNFDITSADDWEDIPEGSAVDIETAALLTEAAVATDVRVLQLVQPAEERTLPGYMTEEEEDLRWSVAMGNEPPAKLAELLDRLGAPSSEMTMTLA